MNAKLENLRKQTGYIKKIEMEILQLKSNNAQMKSQWMCLVAEWT